MAYFHLLHEQVSRPHETTHLEVVYCDGPSVGPALGRVLGQGLGRPLSGLTSILNHALHSIHVDL